MQAKLPERKNDATSALQVTIVALQGTGLTGIFGPAEVFMKTNEVLGRTVYDVRIVAADGSAAISNAIPFFGMQTIGAVSHPIDTLLIAGDTKSQIDRRSPQSQMFLTWLRRQCPSARRFGALCAGTFALAEAGLLRRRQATTHWTRAGELASRYPETTVHSDRLFVKDGNCYTSAGGASALDLALLLVEEDVGSQVALEVAKALVLFLRRTGDEPQLSHTLLAQRAPVGSINQLLIWMADHLAEDLSVASLARRVAMSPRNFARTFLRCVGKTPGQHVVDLRMEAAHRNLRQTALSLSEVARMSGFGSVEALRRLFTKKTGLPPGRFRETEQRAPFVVTRRKFATVLQSQTALTSLGQSALCRS